MKHTTNKQIRKAYEMYKKSTKRTLQDVYTRYSKAKEEAYTDIITNYYLEDGWTFRVITRNIHGFTCGYMSIIDGQLAFNYYTRTGRKYCFINFETCEPY